jgi:hypothetical protein
MPKAVSGMRARSPARGERDAADASDHAAQQQEDGALGDAVVEQVDDGGGQAR